MADPEIVYPGNPFGRGVRREERLVSLPLNSDSSLRVYVCTSVVGLTFVVSGTRRDTDGNLQPIAETLQPTYDRAAHPLDIALGAGELVNLSVAISGGTAKPSQAYCLAQLMRGVGAAKVPVATVCGGSPTQLQPVCYPGTPFRASLECLPFRASYAHSGGIPLGADITETVPVGARWELLAYKATFTASAAIANRRMYFRLLAAGVSKAFLYSAVVATAGQTVIATWAPLQPFAVDTTIVAFNAPLIHRPMLEAGDTFGPQTLGIDAADAWGASEFLVNEWLVVG